MSRFEVLSPPVLRAQQHAVTTSMLIGRSPEVDWTHWLGPMGASVLALLA